MISAKTRTGIGSLDNPRTEAKENILRLPNKGLCSLGFDPAKLEDGLLTAVEETVVKNADRIDPDVILSNARW